MGTEWYPLRHPLTSITTQTTTGGHVILGVWVNHAKAGELTLRNDEARAFVLALTVSNPVGKVVSRGFMRDRELKILEPEWTDHRCDPMTVVSEVGDVLPWGALRQTFT